MRLCMFHPVDHPMERGWVGRIEGDRVVHLAAQTLQSFFTGGGARDHAVYPLAAVRLLAPVLHPPAVRVFDEAASFEFRNPAAVVGPERVVAPPRGPSDTLSQGLLELRPRLAAVVGGDGEVGGFTLLADWRDPRLAPPKDRDFALGLGPAVCTPDDLDPSGLEVVVLVGGRERARGVLDGFDWSAAHDLAARGTTLYPGDLLAAPSPATVEGIGPGDDVAIEVPGIGTLRQTVAGPV